MTNNTSRPQPTSRHVTTEEKHIGPPSRATGRPYGDFRTAQQIIRENPELREFDIVLYPPGYKEQLYRHVGNWTTSNPDPVSRANAAYNAAQVFDYIISGQDTRTRNSVPGRGVTNGLQYGGYPPSDSSHASLLGEFAKQGYPALVDPMAAFIRAELAREELARGGSQPTPQQTAAVDVIPTALAEKNTDFAPNGASERPAGDRRTATQILSANPIVKTLPSSISNDALMRHLGNWTVSNRDPEARADAAYSLAKLLNYIDDLEVKASARGSNSKHGDGVIRGEYSSSPLPHPFDEPAIRDGTEAALLKAFSEQGYSIWSDHGTPLAYDNEKITAKRRESASRR